MRIWTVIGAVVLGVAVAGVAVVRARSKVVDLQRWSDYA